MKTVRITVLLCLTCVATAQPPAKEYFPDTDPLVVKKLEQWQDMKFGLLMHWGPYSQWGVVESWSICSEDEDWCRRPTEDYVEYKKRYEGLKLTFNPEHFAPEKWARAARQAGMRYMIFTTKHHDGFSMFDTKRTPYRITDSECPFSRNPRANVTQEIFEAFRTEGLWTGAYFSKPDWHSEHYWWPNFATPDRHVNYDIAKYPARWKQFVDFTQGQLDELLTGYGRVDILWLDGGWVRKRTPEQVRAVRASEDPKGQRVQSQDIDMAAIVRNARSKQPGILVVDREVPGPFQNYLTPENRVPSEGLSYPWETCMPMATSWSYVPKDKYKPTRELVHLLVDIVAKGGNFLLNIGPGPDGDFDTEAYKRLAELGDWMSVNGPAIYGTRPIAPYRDGRFRFTRSGDKTVFAIYLPAENESLPVSLAFAAVRPAAGAVISLLGYSGGLPWTTQGGLTVVQLPADVRRNPPARHAWALRISEIDK